MPPLLVSLYFALLPFQWALSLTPSVDLAVARPAALFLVLFWVSEGLRKRQLNIALDLGTFFLSAFLAVATLSVLWSQDAVWAIRKLLFLWSFLPLWWVLRASFTTQVRAEKVMAAVVAGGAVAALVGLVQFFLQFPFGVATVFHFWTDRLLPFFLGGAFGEAVATYPSLLVNISGRTLLRVTAFFPDPHMFAFYMGMVLPLAVYLACTRGRLWWGAVFLLLLADLLSFSRGGYVGLGVGLIVWGLGSLRGRRIRGRQMVVGVLVLLLFGAFVFSTPVGGRLVSAVASQEGSNAERLRLWSEAISHISERPWLGVGLGNYPLLVKPSALYREPIYAHDLYLDIAVEIGLVGLVFFCGFLLTSFIRAWQNGRHHLVGTAAASALSVFAVHALFETPLYSVHVLPLLLLVAALASADTE